MNATEQEMLASVRAMTCIGDLRKEGWRRVPKVFRDYVEAASYAKETLRANRAGLGHINIRQKVLVDISNRTRRREFSTTRWAYRSPIRLARTTMGSSNCV